MVTIFLDHITGIGKSLEKICIHAERLIILPSYLTTENNKTSQHWKNKFFQKDFFGSTLPVLVLGVL